MNKKSLKAIASFIVVGVISNGIGLALFAGFLKLGLPPELSAIIMNVIALAIAHHLNRTYTFGFQGSYWKSLFKYYYTSAAMVGLQLVCLSFATRVLGANPILSQAVIIVGFTLISFQISKLYVFATGKAKHDPL